MEPCPAPSGSWPWWRGPHANGVSDSGDAPDEWSETENIIWNARIPGRGHSSPVVWADQVLVTTADSSTSEQVVLCFALNTGDLLWRIVAHQGGFVSIAGTNSHASSTPACDGQRVLVTFLNRDALWVTAIDMDGTILWQTKAGPFHSVHGGGPSPAVYGPLVFVNGDNAKSGFVAALDRETGELIWRMPRKTYYYGGYATPVVTRIADRPQLLLSGLNETTSFDPAAGSVLWTCRGPADQMANTVAFADPFVFISGGYPQQEILCIRADGRGDVSQTHTVWQTAKSTANVSSPLVTDSRLYTITDAGVVTCRDIDTAEVHWQHRLRGGVYASPVVCNGKIYASTRKGETHVFRDATQFERIATNRLDGPIYASPAISTDKLLIRTETTLYCIGK